MIKTNFSTSLIAANYIASNRKTNNFIQKELITRIVSTSLSFLFLTDLAAHAFAALQKTFYTLYKGLIKRKGFNFSETTQHLKSMKVFAGAIFTATPLGMTKPDPKSHMLLETPETSSVCGLLLSRHPQYAKDRTVDCLDFLNYLETLSQKLSPEEKIGMEESLELLQNAKQYLKKIDRLHFQNKLLDAGLCPLLAKKIEKLTQCRDSLFKKEITTRLLALGLSLAAALDLFLRFFVYTLTLLEAALLDFFILNGKAFHKDLKEIGLIFLFHLRDLILTLPAVFTGSAIGIVSPRLGSRIGNLASPLYSRFRFSASDITTSIGRSLEALQKDKSLLIPFSFDTNDAEGGHIVYLLATKKNHKFTLSVINKGYGSEIVQRALGERQSQKIPINYTVHELSQRELLHYFHDLFNDPTTLYSFSRDTARTPGEILRAKAQTTGDCPKASLLGALRYHSHRATGDSVCYKAFLRNLKKRALTDDGHLMDIALGVPYTGEPPSVFIRKKIEASAA